MRRFAVRGMRSALGRARKACAAAFVWGSVVGPLVCVAGGAGIGSLWFVGLVPAPAWAEPRPFAADTRYEAGFSPSGGAAALVISAVEGARTQILVAAYDITSKPIAHALMAAQRRGVRVFMVVDGRQLREHYSVVPMLVSGGVQVRVDSAYDAMHSKFMVIDAVDVELGSFNYTVAATSRNEENALVLHGVPALAAQYTTEWKRMWEESQPASR